MADQATVATTDTTVVPAPKQEVKEETLGTVVTEPAKSDTVPLSKYMEEKRENKKLSTRIAELEGQKGSPVDEDLAQLAKEFDANPELLARLDKRFGSKKTEDDSDIKKELNEIKSQLQSEKLDKIFDGLWNKASEIDADLMAVADKDTLKKLALLPENQGLTLTQLAEKTYEKAVKGKRTIESSRPGARGANDTDIDYSKMSDEDWDTVNKSPELKKKYDEYLINSIRF